MAESEPEQSAQQHQQGRRPSLEEVLWMLARELHEATEQRKIEFEWHKSQAHNADLATKKDLEEMEKRLSALITLTTKKRVRFDWAVGPVRNKAQTG